MKKVESIFSFECPSCHNKTLYDIDSEPLKVSDVDYHDRFICDECGSEYLAEPQYNGTVKFLASEESRESLLSSFKSTDLSAKVKAYSRLRSDIRDQFLSLVKSPTWGYESEKEVEEYLAPMLSISDDPDDEDYLIVEFRAEVNYEELEEIGDSLNKVIQRYDKDAYFEPVTSGITRAYLKLDDIKESVAESFTDEYVDDTSDGHWSWDYDDDELANIYGGDTKYDENPGGIDINPIPKYKVRADMTKYLENYRKDTKFSMNKITESADNRLSYNSIRYKGYRISLLTDGSGYAIFDKHGEMEDHGFKSIKDAKSAIDEFNSIYKPVLSKGLSEASYGGAFDIEDNQYFTREDIIDFGNKVCEILGEIYPDTFDISDTYIYDNNILFLEVTSEQGNEGSANFKIDMRKIKKPSDLLKFADEMVFYLRQDLEELYTNNSIFTESASDWRYVASKMVPDSDGFLTDYTWYENTKDGCHVFIFGDNDIYDDLDSCNIDWETDSYSEARSWFDNYHGFDEEDM